MSQEPSTQVIIHYVQSTNTQVVTKATSHLQDIRQEVHFEASQHLVAELEKISESPIVVAKSVADNINGDVVHAIVPMKTNASVPLLIDAQTENMWRMMNRQLKGTTHNRLMEVIRTQEATENFIAELRQHSDHLQELSEKRNKDRKEFHRRLGEFMERSEKSTGRC